MSCISSISSNFLKKNIPLYTSTSPNPPPFTTISMKKLHIVAQYRSRSYPLIPTRVVGLAHDPTYIPGESPPELPTAPPFHSPSTPQELPQTPNVPDFDPIPPEKPADPPPLSPGPDPGPEFPGPPSPSPPKPETPWPTIPFPPGKPEVIPPHGPDVVPRKPSEPGPPQPTQPDIPPPITGSNGLAFC